MENSGIQRFMLTDDFRPYGRKSSVEFRYFPSVRTDGATLLPKVVVQTK